MTAVDLDGRRDRLMRDELASYAGRLAGCDSSICSR